MASSPAEANEEVDGLTALDAADLPVVPTQRKKRLVNQPIFTAIRDGPNMQTVTSQQGNYTLIVISSKTTRMNATRRRRISLGSQLDKSCAIYLLIRLRNIVNDGRAVFIPAEHLGSVAIEPGTGRSRRISKCVQTSAVQQRKKYNHH